MCDASTIHDQHNWWHASNANKLRLTFWWRYNSFPKKWKSRLLRFAESEIQVPLPPWAEHDLWRHQLVFSSIAIPSFAWISAKPEKREKLIAKCAPENKTVENHLYSQISNNGIMWRFGAFWKRGDSGRSSCRPQSCRRKDESTRKETINLLIKSKSLDSTQSPVSGYCWAWNEGSYEKSHSSLILSCHLITLIT